MLNKWVPIIILLIFTSHTSAAAINSAVLIGASMTLSSTSPGDILAERLSIYGDSIKKHAYVGRSNIHSFFIRDEYPNLPSDILIALDLFFHDVSYVSEWPEEFDVVKDRIQRYVSAFSSKSKYVLLGDTFGLYESDKPAAKKINDVLYDMASRNSTIVVLPLSKMMEDIWAGNYKYDVAGVVCVFKSNDILENDGLHPNANGEYVLANLLLKELKSKSQDFRSVDYISLDPDFFAAGTCRNSPRMVSTEMNTMTNAIP